MTTGTIDPLSTLRTESKPVIVRDMVSRRNINALTEAGARRTVLRSELDAVEDDINKLLTKAYKEGWTWPELMEASSLSLGTLQVRLRKLGLTTPETDRRRSKRTPVAQERKAAERTGRGKK